MPTRKRSHKSKVRIPIGPTDILGPAKYHSYDFAAYRRSRLDAWLKRRPQDYQKLVQILNAVAIRFKNTQPRLARNLRSDMAYLKKKYRPPERTAKRPTKRRTKKPSRKRVS